MTISKNNYFKVFLFLMLSVGISAARAEDCLKKKGEACVTCCLNKYVNTSPPLSSPYYPAGSENESDKAKPAMKQDDSDGKLNASYTEYDDCRKQCK